MDEWQFWRDQLAGKNPATTPGKPWAGFYRDRSSRAIAIWYDDAGACQCVVTSGYQPRHLDEIDELFGFVCRSPITRDLFMAIQSGAGWPEDVEPAERGIGDNSQSLEPHEAIEAEIESLCKRFADWLATLANGISNDTEDAKAAKYAEAVGDLKKKAEDAHKSEKAPWLEGGRKIDAAWNPVIAVADASKKTILASTRDYRLKRDEAERKAREQEAQRVRMEQEAARAAGEPPPIAQTAPKKPSGLRTVRVVEITDIKALALQIASMNEPAPDFVDVLKTIARRMIERGVKVDGARIVEEKRAA